MNSLTVFESGASSDVLRYSSTEVWISCGFSLEDGVRLRIATRVGSELGSPQLASQIGNSVMIAVHLGERQAHVYYTKSFCVAGPQKNTAAVAGPFCPLKKRKKHRR